MTPQTQIKLPWDDWKIVKKLGGGSFGAVYEIERELFGDMEKAALKVIQVPRDASEYQELTDSGFDRDSINSRFYSDLSDIANEYKLMAQLKGNANIIHCEDIKHMPNPNGIGYSLFIRMELLHPMSEVLTFPPDDSVVIQLGTDLCNALSACRKHNIIHRDIKPANILVSASGTFKLGDFGVSKTADRTAGGTKTGTFNYMAPEVYNNQPYNQLVDIYSLGMVLYWMLNRRVGPFLPLPPEMPTANQADEARKTRFSGTPIPPPADGSEALKAVVLKACAFDPADRYQTPEEFSAALRAAAGARAASASPAPEQASAEKPKKERRYGWVMPDGEGSTTAKQTVPDSPAASAPAWDDAGTGEQTLGNSWGEDADKTVGTAPADGFSSVDPGATVGAEPQSSAKAGSGQFDLTAEVTITPEEAANGFTRTVTFGSKTINYTIPKGTAVQDGTRLRCKGCGKEDAATGARGDGYITVHIRRNSAGIWNEKPLPYTVITKAQAKKGGAVTVNGKQVKYPADCKDGYIADGVRILIMNLDPKKATDLDSMSIDEIRKLAFGSLNCYAPDTGTTFLGCLVLAGINAFFAMALPFFWIAVALWGIYALYTLITHPANKRRYEKIKATAEEAKYLIKSHESYAVGEEVRLLAPCDCIVTNVPIRKGLKVKLGQAAAHYQLNGVKYQMRVSVAGTIIECRIAPERPVKKNEVIAVIRKEEQ